MKAVFADTFYFLALLNRNDASHRQAIAASQVAGLSYVTTEFVLLELADALSKPPLREEFKSVRALIDTTKSFRVVPASSDLLHRGLTLFFDRPDKEWQLTDCISFVVMDEEGIKEALTGDRHFEQAGFSALLKLTPV
jgi:predicted nucleic acid-binding protein